MKLWECSGKKVKITLFDGQKIAGIAYDYTSALDNEPDEESITIDSVEIFASEIKSIEVME